MNAAFPFLLRHHLVSGTIRTRVLDSKLIDKLRYESAWKRLSGDWNTAIGNTIINFIVVVDALLMLPAHLRPTTVTALALGDDYLGILGFAQPVDPKPLTAALDHFESSLGITPKRAIFSEPLDVSFISMELWPRRCGGYQFAPKPAKQLTKLFWTVKRLHPKYIQAYRNGICMGLWHTYKGFTMMETFLKAHYKSGVKSLDAQAYRDDFYHWGAFSQVDRQIDWRQGFLHKYKLPISVTHFDWDIGPNPSIYHHVVVEQMLAWELSDPDERCR